MLLVDLEYGFSLCTDVNLNNKAVEVRFLSEF